MTEARRGPGADLAAIPIETIVTGDYQVELRRRTRYQNRAGTRARARPGERLVTTERNNAPGRSTPNPFAALYAALTTSGSTVPSRIPRATSRNLPIDRESTRSIAMNSASDSACPGPAAPGTRRSNARNRRRAVARDRSGLAPRRFTTVGGAESGRAAARAVRKRPGVRGASRWP